MATTTSRGLGWQHQKRRAVLLRLLIDGTLCWWCGKPMYRSQDLSADHSIARAKGGRIADRLLHTPCNQQRGDGSKDHLRPALANALVTMPRTTREW
jgi:5-methylcytosine-specific restriction endonuclease McrA